MPSLGTGSSVLDTFSPFLCFISSSHLVDGRTVLLEPSDLQPHWRFLSAVQLMLSESQRQAGLGEQYDGLDRPTTNSLFLLLSFFHLSVSNRQPRHPHVVREPKGGLLSGLFAPRGYTAAVHSINVICVT